MRFPTTLTAFMSAEARGPGNQMVSYFELGGVWGHDTFLLDVQNVGSAIRGFLS